MNKQYDSRTADKFVVRLPEGLRTQVEQSAGTSDTSMNTVFIQALRQYLDNQGRQQVLLDALAAAYVRAGEKEHELRFQLHDREGSRRDWFEEAQRLEKRYCCLANDQLELVKELDALRAKLAERDALLEDWHAANAAGEVKVSDKAYRIVTRTAAALSANAEPSGPKCGECGDTGVVDDGEITHSEGGIPYENGPIKCVKDCPNCALVERDERAETTLSQVMQAYDYAMQHPHKYLIGTTNWCAAVAHNLNEQARAALDKATEGKSHE